MSFDGFAMIPPMVALGYVYVPLGVVSLIFFLVNISANGLAGCGGWTAAGDV